MEFDRGLLNILPGYDPFRGADGCRFDDRAAKKALAFFPKMLRHVEGAVAGKPFVLEPWQQSFIANLFGWKTTDSSNREVRRYREALLYCPRKSGKTPLAAGICLYCLFCDGEVGAQIFSAAAEREQAALLFRHARGMVEANPEMNAKARVFKATGMRSIVLHNDQASSYRVLSADASSKHGGNPHLVVVDELHAQPNSELVDVLTTSMASQNRKQPLIVYITTADYIRESICNTKYDKACKVRDGVVNDPSFLPAIYEIGPDDDWTSEAVWAKANPNLGISVSIDYLRRECETAKVTPSYENTFKRLHLNLRTQQDVRWLPLALWDKGGQAFDEAILDGLSCFAGLDFGWRDDYAALVLVFPVEPLFYVLPCFWLPRECRRDKYVPPTNDFIAEGLVELTEGNSTDVDAIYEKLRLLSEKYTIQAIVLDPSNARKQGQDLMNEGYNVIEFVQSKRNYNEPCRFLEATLKEGKIRHGGHKVLRWMASNAAAEMNGLGELMPKKKLSKEKIDGISALCMAISQGMVFEGESVYDTQGIDIL